MFWESFAEIESGPCLFWEKGWGTINSASYCEKIVPLIDGMIHPKPWLSAMLDNALARFCEAMAAEFRKRYITPIK